MSALTILGPFNQSGESRDFISIYENTTFVYKFEAQQTNVTWTLDGGDDDSLFKINNNSGELSFKEAPDYENKKDSNNNNVYVVKIKATSSDGLNSAEKEIYVSVRNNLTETLLSKLLGRPSLQHFIALLLFSIEIYSLVMFIRKRKNLNNLTRKDKISLAKIIINLLGLLISTIGTISSIIYISINYKKYNSDLEDNLYPLIIILFLIEISLLFASSITAIVKLVETRNDPNDTDKIITYIQAIGYPIAAIGLLLLWIFFESFVEDIERNSKKKSKDRRSKLKQLLGSKK